MGSKEKQAKVPMQAGVARRLTIEYRAATSFAAGVHLGCITPIADDPIAEAVNAATSADAAVVIVGLDPESETEGRDRESIDLIGTQNDLIAAVAKAQPNTIVVVNAGSVVSMPWSDDVAAIVYAWYPGQECGNALADVLFGRVNPSGKLPQTIPMRYEDHAALDNYPGDGGVVRYEEGVFVGYRHFERNHVKPRYPFGFGLSYTTFEHSDVRANGRDVEVDVTNTGDVAGKEVVQLYVSDNGAPVERPLRELKAFQKIALEPGETKTVRFTLDDRAFQYWGDEGWTMSPGPFEYSAGMP
jgi:beta-glucosidase